VSRSAASLQVAGGLELVRIQNVGGARRPYREGRRPAAFAKPTTYKRAAAPEKPSAQADQSEPPRLSPPRSAILRHAPARPSRRPLLDFSTAGPRAPSNHRVPSAVGHAGGPPMPKYFFFFFLRLGGGPWKNSTETREAQFDAPLSNTGPLRLLFRRNRQSKRLSNRRCAASPGKSRRHPTENWQKLINFLFF